MPNKGSYFDEPLEWEFYELWHHEGRRARIGTAMMATDYAWWHGFYELKHRFNHIFKMGADLKASSPSPVYYDFPGRMTADDAIFLDSTGKISNGNVHHDQ